MPGGYEGACAPGQEDPPAAAPDAGAVAGAELAAAGDVAAAEVADAGAAGLAAEVAG
jgi:hypothetical protein